MTENSTPTATRICVRCRGSQLDHRTRMVVRNSPVLEDQSAPGSEHTISPRPCPRCEGQGVEPRPTDRSFLIS